MTDRVKEVAGAAPTAAARNQPDAGLAGFLFAVQSGEEIEQLVLRDAARQRRTACSLRSARREQQMNAAQEAARKLRQAATTQMWSALVSTGINIGLSFLDFGLKLPETSWANILVNGGKQLFSNYVPGLSEKQADLQARAGQLQTQSDIYAQQSKDMSDWLQSARELEQRLIAHLEKQVELDQRSRNF